MTMTTYNLQVLTRMAQHHYGSTDVPQPTAEEVETALNNIMCEVMELEDRIAEMSRLFKLILPEMDTVDKMCEITGKHPFTGMRGSIELGIKIGEGEWE